MRFCGVQGMSVVRCRGSRARRYGRCADGDAGGERGCGVCGACGARRCGVLRGAGWRRAEVRGAAGRGLAARGGGGCAGPATRGGAGLAACGGCPSAAGGFRYQTEGSPTSRLPYEKTPANGPAPFRPCLSRFFAKGTVAHDPRPRFSTVPLALFCERHGHARPPSPLFDRAFGVFLQKARSRNPSGRTFRPCLSRFFAKGTVVHPILAHFSTVPLTLFCKRHGHLRPTTHGFDRAFDVFL